MTTELVYKIGAFEFKADLTLELEACDTNDKRAKVWADAIWGMVSGYHNAQNWAAEHGIQAYMNAPVQQQPTMTIVNGGVPQQPSTQKSVESITVPVVRLTHGNEDGKESFKVFGGNFTKYGVPAYQDSCVDKVGLFTHGYGTFTPDKPMLMTIQMRGKDPYRVTEIIYNG